MGEKVTPAHVAEQVKNGDRVRLTVLATVSHTSNGSWRYNTSDGVRLQPTDVESVELLPPEPQPGEWWLVRVEKSERVLVFTPGDRRRWYASVACAFPAWGPDRVTPLRKMTFADGAG